MVVAEQQAGSGIAGHVDVRPAIVVEIRGHHGEAEAAVRFADAGCGGDIGESAVAVVVIERVAPVAQAARPAVHGNTEVVAGTGLVRARNRLHVEQEVVGDEQIEAAVAVVVHERAAGAEARLRRSSSPASRVTSVNVPSPLLR